MLLSPLAGAALNGIFGRRFSQASVSAIGCGASGLSMIFALLSAWTFSHPEPEAGFFQHTYFTWIQAGNFRADFALYYDRLTLVMTCTVTVVAFLIHLYSRGYMEHEGGYYRFFLPEPLPVHDADAGQRRELSAHVRGLGRRRAVLLSADRLLLHQEVGFGRRQEGVHRHPDRRRRLYPGRRAHFLDAGYG